MRLSTRQIVTLEILLLANLLVAAMGLIVALAEGGNLSRTRLSHSPEPTQIAARVAVTATQPAAQLPADLPTLASLPTLTVSLNVTASSTPTPVVLQKYQLALTPTDTTISLPTDLPLPPTATLASAKKPKVKLLKITGHPQTLPLSCEARSAVDWAGYFGVAIDELDFFDRLPVSDNPEIGFVGDVRSGWGQIPPHAYGVHAEPVAAMLREYGLSAIAVRGMAPEEVRAQIDDDLPVIVWVTGHVAPGKSADYVAADGQTVLVAPYEHTVMVIGYTADHIMVLDGRKRYWRSWELFLESWGVLGNMAVVAQP